MPNLPTELINNISTKVASLPNTKLRSLFSPQQNSQLQRVLISATQMEPQEDEAFTKPAISSKDSILPMPNLPTELITEILLKLPVKSLLKFRSVSKSWLELISTPHFVKTHLLLSTSNKDYTHHGVMFKFASTSDHGVKDCSLSALLYDSVTEALDLDYPGKNPNGYPCLVGSVNGLICLSISLFHGLDDLFIWNPSIRRYKKLPNYRLNYDEEEEEPGDFKFGFGYDELQDDYKVVGAFPIYRYIALCRVEVKIYSLRSNSWRRIGDFQDRELKDHSAKFVNGKLHWLDRGRNIISFDLADEKWAEVEQLSCFEGCGWLNLGLFGSDLSVVSNYVHTRADVWVMKEYGVKESWTKMFTIKSPEDGRTFFPSILMSNEGEILLQFGSRFAKYNPKDDSIRYLNVTNLASCIEAEIFVKSLVWPFSRNATTMEAEITQLKTIV
ncbi:F-box/kelch-repeat protein At3g23880-like isoform X1 [Lycium ferocissimum]|uniref:F-box/kelch-repeat protein At3g23880-like isoform X1 n=1 Tax=Lycium ferocissimum TaxID=112874 RepID=UPI002814C3C6|nr:F-box/kelch-repeat protein At3g23880-like isoform X1 [Lycium ferocissimum]